MNQSKKVLPVGYDCSGAREQRQKLNCSNDVAVTHVAAFLDAMRDAGVPPADLSEIVADGRLHRYRVEGDKSGSQNGWVIFHLDGVPSGAFGSWKEGITQTWSAKAEIELSPSERNAQRHRIALARAERDAEHRQRRVEAADKARALWARAKPADACHPYIQAKQVSPLQARQLGKRLVLPVYELASRELVSLQFIDGDGGKRLLSGGRKQGCMIPIARPDDWRRLIICEGWATGATLTTMEPDAFVIAAIDAGNLAPVACAVRRDWPHRQIVIAGDVGPCGETKARAAAIAAEALVAIPPGEDGTDWNDVMVAKGASA